MEKQGKTSGFRRSWIPWMGILLAILSASCARAAKPVVTAEEPKSEAPVTPAEPVTSDAAPAQEPAEPAAPTVPVAARKSETEAEEKKPDSTTVYIDPGDSDKPRTRSLVEASRAEKERRAKASGPVTVITNKNLSQFKKGKVTVADPKAGDKKEGGKDLNQDEENWRKRGLEIRIRWREATEHVKQLELDTAGWRRRFYSENDASIRDHQIKPEWDRTLDQLRQARIAVETAQKDLAKFLEEGRNAGALPGWLREGAELEPAVPPSTPSPTDSIEPPIAEIDGKP